MDTVLAMDSLRSDVVSVGDCEILARGRTPAACENATGAELVSISLFAVLIVTMALVDTFGS